MDEIIKDWIDMHFYDSGNGTLQFWDDYNNVLVDSEDSKDVLFYTIKSLIAHVNVEMEANGKHK